MIEPQLQKSKRAIMVQQRTNTLVATYLLVLVVMGCVSLLLALGIISLSLPRVAQGTKVEIISFEDNPRDFGIAPGSIIP
jgi:hypothetical protein